VIKCTDTAAERSFLTRATRRPDHIKTSTAAFSAWHYINLVRARISLCDSPRISSYLTALLQAWAPPGGGGHVPVCPPPQENLLWALEASAAVLRSPKSDAWSRSMMLRMLIHLMGDAHQPLHAIGLYTSAFPRGDEGGNGINLTPSISIAHSSVTELHAFWDAGCGGSGLERIGRDDFSGVALMASELCDDEAISMSQSTFGSTAEMSAAFKAWIYESTAYVLRHLLVGVLALH